MATMNLQGFDKLATNIETMQLIFQYLNFEEQLKLAQVSLQLKYIFSNFIWKVDYAKICIIKHPPNFHVKNETDLNKLKLTSTEFVEFLKLYGPDIKELDEKCDPWLDIRKFPNLMSLSYSNMTVTKPQLQSVVRYCKNLEKFKMYTCTNKHKDMFELGRDLEIKTILEMKKLKCLSLESCIQLPIKYRHFHDIVTKTNIKTLHLKYYIESDERLYEIKKEYSNSLEELDISTTFCEKWWEKNFSTYLSHFEKLVILTLNGADDMTDDTMQVLANTCKRLKKLNINFTTFENVSNFNLLTSLEELNFELCQGLTHSNLRQILTQMNLRKFSSVQTDYEGTFENFIISEKIQYLEIHKLKTCKFKGAYEVNDNLKTLIWYDYYDLPAMEPISLKCPNLENLKIESGFIGPDLILQLTSLHKLSMGTPALHLPWSYIIQLLRDHISLREFSLEDCAYGWNTNSSPREAFKCAGNLKSIQISTEVFRIAIDFWLDLLGKNPNIKLNCTGIITIEFVRNLLKSSKFPGFLKILYIDGVKVACKDLRKNLDSTMEKIYSDTHLPIEAAYANKYGILF